MIEHPEDDCEWRVELRRLATELDAVYAQRDEYFAALQREQNKLKQLTAMIQRAINRWGSR